MAVAPGTVLGVSPDYKVSAQVPAPRPIGNPYGLRPKRGGKRRSTKHATKHRATKHRVHKRRTHRRRSHRRRTHRRR